MVIPIYKYVMVSYKYLVSHLEICAVSKVSKREIGRVFKLILKNLETSVELITTGDFMVRKIIYANKMDLCTLSVTIS